MKLKIVDPETGEEVEVEASGKMIAKLAVNLIPGFLDKAGGNTLDIERIPNNDEED